MIATLDRQVPAVPVLDLTTIEPPGDDLAADIPDSLAGLLAEVPDAVKELR